MVSDIRITVYTEPPNGGSSFVMDTPTYILPSLVFASQSPYSGRQNVVKQPER
ncbi:MAG: hypothetical protein LBK25_02835 [Treponema sp.]|nr:hypothetical protein [Treponema sp.]